MLFSSARSKGNEQRGASDRTYGIRRLISEYERDLNDGESIYSRF
jgi:hypothetical protein